MSLAEQLGAFSLTVVLGIAAGLLYDFYHVARQFLRLRKAAAFAGDLFFSLFLLAFVFTCLLLLNSGEVRFYVLLGLALGMGWYRFAFSAAVSTFFSRLCGGLFRGARMLKLAIIAPLGTARRFGAKFRFWR